MAVREPTRLPFGTGEKVERGDGISAVYFDLIILGKYDPTTVHGYIQRHMETIPEGFKLCQAVIDFEKEFENNPKSALAKTLAVYAGQSIAIYENSKNHPQTS